MLSCKECGGRGVIYKRGKYYKCSCQFDFFAKENLKRAAIPPVYRDCSFENYKPETPSQFFAKRTCAEFANLYPFVDTGIVLFGPTGVGKTHLLVATLRRIVTQKALPVLFVDFRRLLFLLKETFETGESTSDKLRGIMSAELLLIDDFGAGRNTEWAVEVAELIINYRYENRLATLISTNLDFGGSQIASVFGNRIESRLCQMCEVIKVEGHDRRKKV